MALGAGPAFAQPAAAGKPWLVSWATVLNFRLLQVEWCITLLALKIPETGSVSCPYILRRFATPLFQGDDNCSRPNRLNGANCLSKGGLIEGFSEPGQVATRTRR